MLLLVLERTTSKLVSSLPVGSQKRDTNHTQEVMHGTLPDNSMLCESIVFVVQEGAPVLT